MCSMTWEINFSRMRPGQYWAEYIQQMANKEDAEVDDASNEDESVYKFLPVGRLRKFEQIRPPVLFPDP